LTNELVNKLKRGEITNEEFRIKYEGLPKEEETTGEFPSV